MPSKTFVMGFKKLPELFDLYTLYLGCHLNVKQSKEQKTARIICRVFYLCPDPSVWAGTGYLKGRLGLVRYGKNITFVNKNALRYWSVVLKFGSMFFLCYGKHDWIRFYQEDRIRIQ